MDIHAASLYGKVKTKKTKINAQHSRGRVGGLSSRFVQCITGKRPGIKWNRMVTWLQKLARDTQCLVLIH